jgi:hypothetical protein
MQKMECKVTFFGTTKNQAMKMPELQKEQEEASEELTD